MSKKITAEDGLKRCHEKAMARNGQLLSNEWVSSHFKLQWKCERNHIFFADYNHVVSGNTWCPKCIGRLSAEERLSQMRVISKNKGLELIEPVIWNGIYGRHLIKCLKHDYIYETDANNLINSDHGCYKCGREIVDSASTYTQEEAKNILESMGLKCGLNFKYSGSRRAPNDVYFRGRLVKKTFNNMRIAYKLTGLPVGFVQGSAQDSWLGFVCSLASDSFIPYYKFSKNSNQEFDGYDPILKKAYEFNGSFWHKNNKYDWKKAKFAKESNIQLKIIDELEFPESKLEQAKLVLEWMYPEKINAVIELLNTPDIEIQYQNWCDNQGLFDRKKAAQEIVKKDLLENGLPLHNSYRGRRLSRFISPKLKYFSQEIRELAIKLGHTEFNSKQRFINHSRALGIKPFKDQYGNVYQTASEAAVKIGVSNCLISKVLSGKSKHTRGYKLEFLSETA